MSRAGAEAMRYFESAKVEEELEIFPEIREVLDAHIRDFKPEKLGRRDLLKQLGDAAVGAANAEIDRPNPPIFIESANLERGKSKVLIGSNGAGKTTICDGLMERGGAVMDTRNGEGAVVFGTSVHARDFVRIARLDQEELLGKIGDIPAGQVLEQAATYFKTQLPVGDWEDPEAYDRNLKNQEAHTRIEELMSQLTKLFDMERFLKIDVKNLSGGERTKLALFMVMLSEADVLLLDEPTNHLDLRSIAKLTELFHQHTQVDVAVLSISHVPWFLKDAGKDGVLEITWGAQRGRVLKESKASYDQYIKDASREQVSIIRGEVQWYQKEYGYKHGSTLIKTPDHFTVKNSPLRDVECPSIHGGEMVILSGDNGTGKTKLMEELIREHKKGAQVAYLPQFWPEAVFNGTLQDFFFWVKEQSSPYSTGSSLHKDKPARNAFIELARDLNFGGSTRISESWLNRSFAQFSGGEQRLLWFIAVSSLRDIDMLALDEPTNHMDQDLQQKVTRAIQTFPGAVMLSTHDRELMTTLSKDAGSIKGNKRIATHLVLERDREITKVAVSSESPVDYMKRVMEQARKQAKRLKVK